MTKHTQEAPADERALTLEQALRRAFSLGQSYWADADSESYSANRRSEGTRQKFEALVAQMIATPAAPEREAADDLATYWRKRWQRDCAPLGEPTDEAIRQAMSGIEWLPMHDEAEAFDFAREMVKRFATPPVEREALAALTKARINELWHLLRLHNVPVSNEEFHRYVGAILAAAAPDATAESCEWHHDEDGLWQSACGGDPWLFEAEDPTKNGMRFCIHCGKRMVQRAEKGGPHG